MELNTSFNENLGIYRQIQQQQPHTATFGDPRDLTWPQGPTKPTCVKAVYIFIMN